MDNFTVFIDRLKDDVQSIEESVSSSFLEIEENDLRFSDTVAIKGEVYLAEEELIFRLEVQTEAFVPCSICNQPVHIPIEASNFYHAESVSEIRSKIFDYTPLIREAILLQVPSYAECNHGNCPERKNIEKYLKP